MLMRIVPAMVAGGVILAGWVLWRVCASRPALRFMRWVVAVLTAYGAATLVYAAAAGISLRQALSGALLHPVPYVLQRAFIGAFVILPLGWVASVLRAGFPRLRTGSVAPAAVQAIALTACIALLFTSFPRARFSSGSGYTMMNAEERQEALERSLRAIEERERELPRDHWDPDYVVKTVGRDPQQLFAWVRDNTFWIPYHGVLRGPVGVLMDRQGNSLDRAILLATLLQRAGHSLRLAHGQLTLDQVRQLLPTLVARRRVYAGESPVNTPEPTHVQTVAKTTPQPTKNASAVDDESTESVMAHYEPVADAVGRKFSVSLKAADSGDLLSRVAGETAGLLAALDRPDPTKEWVSRAVETSKTLADHWWVQAQHGQSWADFDLLSNAPDHGALATATDTVAPNNLSAELYHQITIRVMAEQWSTGSANVRKALEYTLRPAELIGQNVVLQFWPTAWLGDLSDAGSRHTLREAASQDQWAAALSVGRKSVAQTFLVESGAGAEEQPKGEEFGALGSAMAGALSTAEKPVAELSAVWVEYEIRVPSGPPHTVRRTVFDLLGPQARSVGTRLSVPLDPTKKLTRALALMMRTDVESMICAVPPEFVQDMVAQNLLANRNLLTAVARRDIALSEKTGISSSSNTTEQEQNTPEKLLAEAAPPVSPLLALAAARLRPGYSANPAFIDRPNILARHRFFVPVADQIAAMEAIDIVANEVGVDLAAPEAFPIRLWQGVLDTNLEARVGFATASGNVGEVFAKAKGWAMVSPSQRSDLETRFSSLPADARQRLAQDLNSGNVVVSPQAPVQEAGGLFVGWWRINPGTGDTLGVADSGWGQAVTERATLLEFAVTAAEGFDFEFVMCQFQGQVMNTARILDEKVFGGWHPSWTASAAKSKDPIEVVKENYGGCLIQSMVQGALATLPLLLITLRARGARLAAEEMEAAAEAAAARAERARPPCIGRFLSIPSHRTIDLPVAMALPFLRIPVIRVRLSWSVGGAILSSVLWQKKGSSGGCSPPVATLNSLGSSPKPAEPPANQGPPVTVGELTQHVERLDATCKSAEAEYVQAVKKWVVYKLNDPDPNVAEQMRKDLSAKYRALGIALNQWQDAVDALNRGV